MPDFDDDEPYPDVDDLPPDRDFEPEPTKEEIEAARETARQEIEQFFTKFLEPKVEFLRELSATRPSEAFLLASCYIEGLAQWAYQKEKGATLTDRESRYRFARAITDYCSPDHELARVILKRARHRLEKTNQVPQRSLDALFLSFDDAIDVPFDKFEDQLISRLSAGITNPIRKALWDGTRASLLYQAQRNALTHQLGLTQVFFEDFEKPIPAWVMETPQIVTFDSLYSALTSVIEGVRKKEDVVELFGDGGLWLNFDKE